MNFFLTCSSSILQCQQSENIWSNKPTRYDKHSKIISLCTSVAIIKVVVQIEKILEKNCTITGLV